MMMRLQNLVVMNNSRRILIFEIFDRKLFSHSWDTLCNKEENSLISNEWEEISS